MIRFLLLAGAMAASAWAFTLTRHLLAACCAVYHVATRTDATVMVSEGNALISGKTAQAISLLVWVATMAWLVPLAWYHQD